MNTIDVEFYGGPCDGSNVKLTMEPEIGESIVVPVRQQVGCKAHYKYGGNGICIYINQDAVCEKW